MVLGKETGLHFFLARLSVGEATAETHLCAYSSSALKRDHDEDNGQVPIVVASAQAGNSCNWVLGRHPKHDRWIMTSYDDVSIKPGYFIQLQYHPLRCYLPFPVMPKRTFS